MELWIRSQDKMKLFRGIDIRAVVEQEGCSIIDNTDDYIIGKYKSIERALEVLDEIQNKLTLKLEYFSGTWFYKNGRDMIPIQKDEKILNSNIYEMPEE